MALQLRKKIKYLLIGIIMLIPFLINYSSAYNFEYVNVTSKVNVTNAYPVITKVDIPQNILLNAGATTLVLCNISLYDWNGYDDIQLVNATFWDSNTAAFSDPDDFNNHYTNSSCANTSQSGYYANYTCAFDVWYYANNGTNWTCNATVLDKNNFTDAEINTTSILAYYALNVTPIVDYGNMVLGDYSPNITVNITNIGNSKINISVRGYGGNNPTTGDGLAMICESGNISIGNERYSTSENDAWAAKTPLLSALQNITGLSLLKTTTGSPYWNLTYWQLFVDPLNAPFGLCNGTIEFTAVSG